MKHGLKKLKTTVDSIDSTTDIRCRVAVAGSRKMVAAAGNPAEGSAEILQDNYTTLQREKV